MFGTPWNFGERLLYTVYMRVYMCVLYIHIHVAFLSTICHLWFNPGLYSNLTKHPEAAASHAKAGWA